MDGELAIVAAQDEEANRKRLAFFFFFLLLFFSMFFSFPLYQPDYSSSILYLSFFRCILKEDDLREMIIINNDGRERGSDCFIYWFWVACA